jgi:hypothetical protein
MPDVQVEIAFGSTWSTPAASRVWTDVSAYVELDQTIVINYGRSDESSVPEPNRVTLTLENSDGRFTAELPSGAYYPDVKIGVPIRVTATPVGQAASVRFVGFVEEWPLEWDGGTTTSWVKIVAYSRMARIGASTPLRGNVKEQYLEASNVTAYWPLDDPQGSLTAAPLYGTTTLTTSSIASQFTGVTLRLPGDPSVTGLSSGYNYGMTSPDASFSLSQAGGDIVGECFVSNHGGSVAESVWLFGFTTSAGYLVVFAEADNVPMKYGSGATNSSTKPLGVDPTHVAVVLSRSGGNNTASLYINGALVHSVTAAETSLTATRLFLSASRESSASRDSDVVISHLMLSRDTAGIAERARAGLTGFAGESAGARITRLARWAGIGATEVSVDSGKTVGALDTNGVPAVEAMRAVASADGGILFDAADGTLTFRSSASRYHSAAAALTLSAALHQIEKDFAPKLDRSTLVNEALVTSPGGTASARDGASIAAYGYARSTPSVPSGTLADAAALAAWIVSLYGEPAARVPRLTFDLLTLSAADQTDAFTLAIGSLVGVTGLPSQAASASFDFFVEGYTETIGPESYWFALNVSPSFDLYDDTWILGDATYGVLDSTTKPGY